MRCFVGVKELKNWSFWLTSFLPLGLFWIQKKDSKLLGFCNDFSYQLMPSLAAEEGQIFFCHRPPKGSSATWVGTQTCREIAGLGTGKAVQHVFLLG